MLFAVGPFCSRRLSLVVKPVKLGIILENNIREAIFSKNDIKTMDGVINQFVSFPVLTYFYEDTFHSSSVKLGQGVNIVNESFVSENPYHR
jgi:hypothetical protein